MIESTLRGNEMKSIDLERLTFTKLEIAERQLDRAIRCLLDEDDPICAITLAGAADVVSGGLLKNKRESSAFDELMQEAMACYVLEAGEKRADVRAELQDIFNWPRNELKHHGENRNFDSLAIHPEMAAGLIDRAIENTYKLGLPASEDVRRFLACRAMIGSIGD